MSEVLAQPPILDLDSCRQLRRLIAEDPLWSLAIIPNLSQLCLQAIINNFEGHPIYHQLSPAEREYLQEKLPRTLPLSVTANLIEDNIFWKRCCVEQWSPCDVSQYGHSWKRMFFEKSLGHMVELLIPDAFDKKKLLAFVSLCKNYIKKLDIDQLLLPIKEKKEEKGHGHGHGHEAPSMDHFDFGILIEHLPCLEELHLVYRVKNCGLNFEWKMFQMTPRDCQMLAKAVKSSQTLKLLRIHQSLVDDEKCHLLVDHILDHPTLRELNFSHNEIGDGGARAVAKLVSKGKLEVLTMCDNEITDVGAKAIAQALSRNSSLVSLNLRLNRVYDEGGRAIVEVLMNNKTLRHLHLGSNELTAPTAIALAEVLAKNPTLKSINLSLNDLGEDGGKALQEAMSKNTSVTECDIRLTQIDEKIISSIDQVVWNNQRLDQKKEVSRRLRKPRKSKFKKK